MSRVHRYEGEKIIVEFELGRCIHPGDCTHALPEVFDIRRTGRWVHPDAAAPEKVAQVCSDCPTGALRCIHKASQEPMHIVPERNTIQPIPDGPLYVHADMQVDGKKETTGRTALCRCGASRLMPRCDNSHREIGFCDSGTVVCPLPGAEEGTGALNISSQPDGPLMVKGPFALLDAAGKEACTSGEAALCRCGASKMKPYCDGSHVDIGFKAQ